MAKDDDFLGNAIIATEKDIAAGAWDAEAEALDPSGDRSLEEMGDGLEGQHEDSEEDEDPDDPNDDDAHPKDEPEKPDAVEAKDKPKEGEVIAPEEPKGRIPPGRLREEADARRKAEAERDELKAKFEAATANEKTSLDTLRAEFDRKLAEALKKPEPVAEKPKVPDLFEDPTAFAEHINRGVQERFDAFQRQQRDREVNASLNGARERHGDTFKAAWDALNALPKNQETAQLAQRLEAQPNPGEAIVSWHKRNVAAREVGDDLEGYKARIANEAIEKLRADPEFRKQLLADLRGEAEIGDNGRLRNGGVRLPRSLSQASGGNSRGVNDDGGVLDGSDEAIAASAWT